MKSISIGVACLFLVSCASTQEQELKLSNPIYSVTDGKVLTDAEISKLQVAYPKSVYQPRYPYSALKAGIEGKVVFIFDVDANGSPKNIKIVESVPEGVFDNDAFYAIKKWKFKPALDGEKAITQKGMKYTLDFKLAK